MRRFFVALSGLAWGLLLTWLSLYTFSHLDWSTAHAQASGCSDMEHCSPRIVVLSALLGTLSTPALGFAILNAVAYRRWSTRKWAISFGVGSILVVLFYLAGFVVPRF